MRKIEKETLAIINEYNSESYSHYKKLISIRENEIKEELEKELEAFMEKRILEEKIKKFENKFKTKVNVSFELSIRSYYTDYQELFNNDKIINDLKKKITIIENERNKMKLILQNEDKKSEKYKAVIKLLEGEK